jgi:hypothetical protein
LVIDVRARDLSGARNGLRFILRGLGVLLVLLFVTSCGNSIFIVGTGVVTLTTQRGHFTSYVVNIDAIEMTRKDGTVIELPTLNLRVDLAQISSYVNLLETPALGEGSYVSATIVLDYTAPYITIDYPGQLGTTTLIDSQTAAAPTTQTFTITLDPNNPMTVGNQTAGVVNFNIDLEASNTIDTSKGLPATVTVHPVVTVTSTPVYTKPVLSRGIFVYVDSKNNDFVMNTRPLHDVVSNQTFGALTVIPNAQTYWNIDGVPYSGANGLAALAKLQSQTAELQIGAIGVGNGQPAPFGNLGQDLPSFTATEVYVGSSLESTIQDHITGVVAEISADTLTIVGGWSVDRLGDPGFAMVIPVTVGTSTIVSADGNANVSPTLNSISVGQFIDVSGVVTYVADGSTNPASLDATAGQVRIQPTTLWATLVPTASTTTVSLDRVAYYEPANFNFAGTGTSTTFDATAGNYIINTGSLTVPTSPTDALFPGLLRIVGTANTFGQGPPYFTASSIQDASALPQRLILEWSGSGSNNPYTNVAPSGLLSVNLNDANLAPGVAGAVHVIRSGLSERDVNSLPNPNPGVLVIVPSAPTATGSLFTIGNTATGLSVYNTPATFAVAVASAATSTTATPTNKLVATGQYDPSTGTFTATNIEISVH